MTGRGRLVGWVAVALLALMGLVLAFQPTAEPRAAVLVGASDLPTGTLLDDLAGGGLEPAEIVPPEGALELPGPEDVPPGTRLVAPLAAGEILTWVALGGYPGIGPAPLAEGERAIALPASVLGSTALAVAAGSRVDLVSRPGGAPVRLLAYDAEVMAVNHTADGEAGGLLLRVAASDALALAGSLGFSDEVRIVVRPPGERGAPELPPEPEPELPMADGPADLGDAAAPPP